MEDKAEVCTVVFSRPAPSQFMVSGGARLQAVTYFCKAVILSKEKAKCVRNRQFMCPQAFIVATGDALVIEIRRQQ